MPTKQQGIAVARKKKNKTNLIRKKEKDRNTWGEIPQKAAQKAQTKQTKFENYINKERLTLRKSQTNRELQKHT